MRSVEDLKRYFDELNYTERELEILHGIVTPTDEEWNALFEKVCRLEDGEWMNKLLRYDD